MRQTRFLALSLALLTIPSLAAAQTVQVFFGNLHSHTDYSDGSLTPEEAYRHARDVARLDFLAITEHNHMIDHEPDLYSGSVSTSLISTANRFTVGGQFVALYGQEFSTISSGNHANVFEVQDVILASDVANGDWRDLLENWIPNHLDSQGQEALLVLNHPATGSSPNSREYGRDDYNTAAAWRAALDARAQLINIINGPSHNSGPPGRPSESEFRRYLNLGFHLAPTADQDNHRSNWGSAAETRTGVIATDLTKNAILDALRARHVYATQDRNLHIIVRVNGELMGTRITGTDVPTTGHQLQIEVEITDDDEPNAFYAIEVFSDQVGGEEAEVVHTSSAERDATTTIDAVTYAGGAQYVFLRITQSHDDDAGADSAWTAPVWIEAGGVPDPGGPSAITLSVDLVAEEVRITNTGDSTIDLSGWRLLSTRGNQEFFFPAGVTLTAGETVTVTSGPNARDEPAAGFLRWTTANVWRNAGDPAELYDADGHLVAEDL
jgi:hypothetical protein